MKGFSKDAGSKFNLPVNIKQIGSIGEELRIYLEDYVYTYLYQYAKSDEGKEKVAVLVGQHIEQDGQTILLISGAIQGKYSRQEKGNEIFTEETWKYIDEKMEQYFEGLEIVGWMHTQPGYGVFLSSVDTEYHRERFQKAYQILFVVDSTERLDAFFAWNEEEIIETLGYFIYYDRNEQMHDYMLDNRVIKMKVQEAEQDVVVNIKKQDRIRRQDIHHKKLINMLSSLSAVLFLVCLLMGIGLIQNGDRISRLETQLKNIDGAYKNVVAQIKADKAHSVFAAQATEQYSATEVIDRVEPEPVITQVSKEAQEMSSQPVEEVILIDESIALSLHEQVEKIEEETVIVNESLDSSKPEPSPSVVEQPKPVVAEVDIPTQYTVAAGDSLNYISYKIYGTTGLVAKIMQANDIDDPNKIYAGKVLKLPKP